jgi:hypothetical protein
LNTELIVPSIVSYRPGELRDVATSVSPSQRPRESPMNHAAGMRPRHEDAADGMHVLGVIAMCAGV